MKEQIIEKLTSRKLWVAIAGAATMMADGRWTEAVIVIVAYLLGQGIADSKY